MPFKNEVLLISSSYTTSYSKSEPLTYQSHTPHTPPHTPFTTLPHPLALPSPPLSLIDGCLFSTCYSITLVSLTRLTDRGELFIDELPPIEINYCHTHGKRNLSFTVVSTSRSYLPFDIYEVRFLLLQNYFGRVNGGAWMTLLTKIIVTT